MTSERLNSCAFETGRLRVREWRSFEQGERALEELAQVVRGILTEPVTRHLPPGWSEAATEEGARRWIAERDREGTTLLAVDRRSGRALGLVILFGTVNDETAALEVRLGYMLAEVAWGKGLGGELVEGLVGWCRSSGVAALIGGVEPGNVASCRVLEKNGFVLQPPAGGNPGDELIYRLRFTGS